MDESSFTSKGIAGSYRSYDVSPDGRRFAVIDMTPSEQPPTQLILVQNWSEELKRLVPPDN